MLRYSQSLMQDFVPFEGDLTIAPRNQIPQAINTNNDNDNINDEDNNNAVVNAVPKSPTASIPAPSLTFSSLSSHDSLPLGCEHKEYFWIKRYRALKRRVSSSKKGPNGDPCESIIEEEEEVEMGPITASGGDANNLQQLARLRRLPCTRFYLENRSDEFNLYIDDLLRNPGPNTNSQVAAGIMMNSNGTSRQAMLRTQQSLVVSPVSSRWFVVDVTRPMRLLVGATTEGEERLQPTLLNRLKIIPIDLQGRGDRIKLLVTPSLGYAPSSGNGGAEENQNSNNDKYKLNGDVSIFVNDVKVGGKFEHTFASSDNIYGIAIWSGSLSDVKLVEY